MRKVKCVPYHDSLALKLLLLCIVVSLVSKSKNMEFDFRKNILFSESHVSSNVDNVYTMG